MAAALGTLTVSVGTSGVWPQWSSIPYFTDASGDALNADADTDIRNVAVANDDSNLYLRLDNTSGHLPGYQTAPEFGIDVYAADYSGTAATTTTGIDGSALPRPVSFLVIRRSTDNRFMRYHVSGGSWVQDADITSVIAPQWDPATGRVEMVIPRSALASGSTTNGTVKTLVVELEHQNTTTSPWTEDDTIALRYQLAGSSSAPIYGDVR